MKPVRVYAPASVGNFSVGFDALGAALSPEDGSLLGDVVTASPSQDGDLALNVSGPFAPDLPADPAENIVSFCRQAFETELRGRGREVSPVALALDKRLPIGSGLGSSASSIVAALVALNEFNDCPLEASELLQLAGDMEGRISGDVHLDNVAPSLLGGLRLCPPHSGVERGLPWPESWRLVVCWPGTSQSTRAAREVLPESVPRQLAVEHGANFARFVHALHAGDSDEAAGCVRDVLAEPHRAALLPGFDEARPALHRLGGLACGISGSGPTLFALANDPVVAAECREWLAEHYVRNESGFALVCRLDRDGARVLDD